MADENNHDVGRNTLWTVFWEWWIWWLPEIFVAIVAVFLVWELSYAWALALALVFPLGAIVMAYRESQSRRRERKPNGGAG